MTPIARIEGWVFIYFKIEIRVLPQIAGSSMGVDLYDLWLHLYSE